MAIPRARSGRSALDCVPRQQQERLDPDGQLKPT